MRYSLKMAYFDFKFRAIRRGTSPKQDENLKFLEYEILKEI